MAEMEGYMAVVEEAEFLGIGESAPRWQRRTSKLKTRRHPAHGCRVSVCGRGSAAPYSIKTGCEQ